MFRRVIKPAACGLVLLFIGIMGTMCHHSTRSGGYAVPFEYSEAAVLGHYMALGISAAPNTVNGPEMTTFLSRLTTDGQGAFSSLEYTSNMNGVIESQQKSGLYEVDEDGTLRFAWDGNMTNAQMGQVIRQGEIAFLTALDNGDDPGFQLFMEYDEPGSYALSQLSGEYWIYGYGFDLTQSPTAVAARSIEMIVDFDPASATYTWSRNYWYNYDWDLNEHKMIEYPAETHGYSVDANGMITISDLPVISELRGVFGKDRATAFFTTLTQGVEPQIYVMIPKGGSHGPTHLEGEFYVLNQAFSFNNMLHAFSFVDLEFDGVKQFMGDYTSNYTLGIENGVMDGSYTVGGVGYTTINIFATNRKLGGGLSAFNDFIVMVSPVGSDNDRSPGLFLFIRK